MGVLACPESWAPLPNLLHPQLHLHQRWGLPGSATSCSSSTASEQRRQQQQQQHELSGGMTMLQPQRCWGSNTGSALLNSAANHLVQQEQQIGYCAGMSMEHLLPQFMHQQMALPGGGGGSGLSAFLDQRGRQLLQLDVVDPDVAQMLYWSSSNRQEQVEHHQDFSRPCDAPAAHQLQQHSSCGDSMVDQVQDDSMVGGATNANAGAAEVVHWTDHIHHATSAAVDMRRGGGGGGSKELEEVHHASVHHHNGHGHGQGGDMDAFFQFGDSMALASDYGVHHWLKEAELEPEPSDLLLDYLTATAVSGSGLRAPEVVDTELHDCKLIGIQDYLPDLDPHDSCSLAESASATHLDVSLLNSSEGEPILECEALEAALPAPPPQDAASSLLHQPAGAALSRTSSRRRLSMEQDEPGTGPQKQGGAGTEEEKLGGASCSIAVAAAGMPKSRSRSAKAGAGAASKAAAAGSCRPRENSGLGVEAVGGGGALESVTGERSKRKSSTSCPPGPPAPHKRSRKAAAAPAAAQDGAAADKPTQRRASARSGASRKRTRQSEQPIEAGATGDGQQHLDSPQQLVATVVVPKRGSKAAAAAGATSCPPSTKRRRTSPAATTAAAAAAASAAAQSCDPQPESACKPQPTKRTRRGGAAARAQPSPLDEPHLDLPPSSERESHVIAERRRRRSMNCMLSTLGSLLPADGNNPKPTDRLKVVAQTISYIKVMQLSMKALTQKKAELTVAQNLLHSTHNVLAASGGHVRRSPSKKLLASFPEHPSSQNSSSSQDDTPTAQPWDNEAGSCDGVRQPLLPVLTLDMFGMEAFITLTCAKTRPDFFWKTLLLLDQLRFKVVTAQKSTNDQMAYHSIHVNNKESEKENKDLKSALERLINSLSSVGFHD